MYGTLRGALAGRKIAFDRESYRAAVEGRIVAISYDSVEILRVFAATHGIAFPLLSDEGSRVIRALGLINARVQEDHAAYGIKPSPRHVDLPYPGVR